MNPQDQKLPNEKGRTPLPRLIIDSGSNLQGSHNFVTCFMLPDDKSVGFQRKAAVERTALQQSRELRGGAVDTWSGCQRWLQATFGANKRHGKEWVT